VIFRQLFEPLSSTYTYLLGCEETGAAILVDPVYPTWERDLAEVRALQLELKLTVETHVHADHITSALRLRDETGCKIAFPAPSRVEAVDIAVEHGKPLRSGGISLGPLYTPGHTDDHFCYLLSDRVLTGDALLIDGCGHPDFQNGDAGTLYDSIHEILFGLRDDCLVYPAHDYKGRRGSSVAQEKSRNPRIDASRTREEFVQLMGELDLSYPKFIDYAVPGNRKGGVCPSHLPADMEEYCQQMTMSPQG
jgi:glyoxylase-like metal-dependent hydrolase (beta-lactamase superfamily II)